MPGQLLPWSGAPGCLGLLPEAVEAAVGQQGNSLRYPSRRAVRVRNEPPEFATRLDAALDPFGGTA